MSSCSCHCKNKAKKCRAGANKMANDALSRMPPRRSIAYNFSLFRFSSVPNVIIFNRTGQMHSPLGLFVFVAGSLYLLAPFACSPRAFRYIKVRCSRGEGKKDLREKEKRSPNNFLWLNAIEFLSNNGWEGEKIKKKNAQEPNHFDNNLILLLARWLEVCVAQQAASRRLCREARGERENNNKKRLKIEQKCMLEERQRKMEE